jgi:hypothetical protein
VARNLRVYGKKRGNRRTGSRAWASAGEAAFFAALLALGMVGLLLGFLRVVVPEWRLNRRYVEHRCRVIDSRIAVLRDDGAEVVVDSPGGPDAAETPGDGTLYRPEFLIEYQVGGETYRAWTYDLATARHALREIEARGAGAWSYDLTAATDLDGSWTADREEAAAIQSQFLAGAEPGGDVPCWYDPRDPRVAVLVRGYSWWIWLVLAVPLSFALIGGGGLIYALLHWGRSAERRALLAQRARSGELFGGNGSALDRGRDDAPPSFPHVPDGADIVNSPGTRLRYRLPIAGSTAWRVIVLAVACVSWNATVWGFAAVAVAGFLEGKPDWLLAAFVVPFLAVGIGLIVLLVRGLLVAAGVGPTRVEISDHPLRPGGRYRLFVSQAGRLTLKRLEVALVCEEEATYRQGTDTRTESCETLRESVLRQERFEMRRGQPFEAECEFSVPADAMHSFQADHNKVQWKVVVVGDAEGWPEYRRGFPVVVRPAPGGGTPA